MKFFRFDKYWYTSRGEAEKDRVSVRERVYFDDSFNAYSIYKTKGFFDLSPGRVSVPSDVYESVVNTRFITFFLNLGLLFGLFGLVDLVFGTTSGALQVLLAVSVSLVNAYFYTIKV